MLDEDSSTPTLYQNIGKEDIRLYFEFTKYMSYAISHKSCYASGQSKWDNKTYILNVSKTRIWPMHCKITKNHKRTEIINSYIMRGIVIVTDIKTM